MQNPYSRSHVAVIRVYDEASNVIQTHEHKVISNIFMVLETGIGNLLLNDLRDVFDNNLRLALVQSDLSRHSHRFALELLRIRKLRRASRWDKSGKGLIRVFAAHDEKNVAFPRLMNAVHFVRYRCDFANMFRSFCSRISGDLGENRSSTHDPK